MLLHKTPIALDAIKNGYNEKFINEQTMKEIYILSDIRSAKEYCSALGIDNEHELSCIEGVRFTT